MNYMMLLILGALVSWKSKLVFVFVFVFLNCFFISKNAILLKGPQNPVTKRTNKSSSEDYTSLVERAGIFPAVANYTKNTDSSTWNGWRLQFVVVLVPSNSDGENSMYS